MKCAIKSGTAVHEKGRKKGNERISYVALTVTPTGQSIISTLNIILNGDQKETLKYASASH